MDPYFWMRDDERKDENVLGHLRAENAHTKTAMSPLNDFTDALYAELKVPEMIGGGPFCDVSRVSCTLSGGPQCWNASRRS